MDFGVFCGYVGTLCGKKGLICRRFTADSGSYNAFLETT